MQKAAFLPMEEALHLLSYASDREVLRAAGAYLAGEAALAAANP